MNQQTLGGELTFEGPGLHTGVLGRVRLHPREEHFGVRFQLNGKVTFPALASYVVETRRATVLGSEGQTVSTVEHLLSALSAMGVDNVLVAVEGPEIPVLDGSAGLFCAGVTRVGLISQNAPRVLYTLDAPMVFRDGDAVLAVVPSDVFRVRFAVDFAAPIGAHVWDAVIDPEFYVREIAAARTFGYLHEVEALRAAGLARGGTMDNALIFTPEGSMTPLRWPNEVVRHKTLDLIGDFALLGARPQCEILSFKSGHRLHVRAVSELRGRLGKYA